MLGVSFIVGIILTMLFFHYFVSRFDGTSMAWGSTLLAASVGLAAFSAIVFQILMTPVLVAAQPWVFVLPAMVIYTLVIKLFVRTRETRARATWRAAFGGAFATTAITVAAPIAVDELVRLEAS